MSETKRVWTTEHQTLTHGYIPLVIAGVEGSEARTIGIELNVRFGYEGTDLVALRIGAHDIDADGAPSTHVDFDLDDEGKAELELLFEAVNRDGVLTNYFIEGVAEVSLEEGSVHIRDARVRVEGSESHSDTVFIEGPEGAVEDPIEGQTAYLESGLSLAKGDERQRVLDVITRPFYNSSGVLTHLLLAAGGTDIFTDFDPNFEDERVWTAVPFDEASGTTQPVALDAPFDLLRESEESFTGTDEVTYTVTSADKDEDGNVIGLSIMLESQNATRVETAVTIDLSDEVRKASPDSAEGNDADASAPADEPA